jgi:hypothetical protein
LKAEFPSFFSSKSESQGEIHFKRGGFVTPYFSKRIEFYKFVYLNKHLIVVFHADAYFPLCCEVFLYFIVQVEVIKIRI